MSALERTEALAPGDACQWRYPARSEWNKGVVFVNGGLGYWIVLDEGGKAVNGLCIEHISAPGERWYDPS